jgi:putative Ca2+/H+ antiporter (TMEM165/GDT1 family)
MVGVFSKRRRFSVIGIYLVTLASVLAVELTDKTRLIALLLSTRFRAPVQLIIGMTLGYVPPTALAVLGADLIVSVVPQQWMQWLVALTFLIFGAYLVFGATSDDEEGKIHGWLTQWERFGPFWIGFVLVAVTEFADKSQVVTAGLMARYRSGVPVFLGSLSAQALLNCASVALGHHVGKHLPVRLIQRVSGMVFILFGIWALVS